MVANTPRASNRAIRSLARTSSFSASSFTLMPSVMVMVRVIGSGSLESAVNVGGGRKPFIGPSFTPRGATYRCPGRRAGPPGLRSPIGGAIPGPIPGRAPAGRVPVGDVRVGCMGRRSPGRNGGRAPGAPAAAGRGRWKIGWPGTGRPGAARFARGRCPIGCPGCTVAALEAVFCGAAYTGRGPVCGVITRRAGSEDAVDVGRTAVFAVALGAGGAAARTCSAGGAAAALIVGIEIPEPEG